jgi:hypothetical protein
MSGQTNDTLYFANSTLPDSGVYHCVVSNPSGSAVSSDAKISVNSVYLYWTTSIIIDTVDCDKDGYNRKFLLKIDPNVKNSGTAFVYAKIYHKNHSDNSYTFISTTLSKTVVGTVSDLLYPDTLIGKEHGEYDYRIILYSNNFSIDTIDINNCKEEMPAQDEILPTITLHPVNKIDSVGVCDTIKATVTGTNLRYQWFKNGNVVSGNSSASIIFSSVYLSDNGQYKCILTNDAGSASDSVILTIHAKHNAQLFYDAFTSNSTSWDTAQSTSSKATISGGYFYFQGDSSYTYRRTRNIAPSSINCYSIESQLKYVSGTKELFGIVLCDNGSSWDNLYIFGIKDDGSCAIYKNLTGNNTNDWQNFFYGYRSVNSGIFNTLKVTKNGTDTYFYLNGQWVFTLSINDCAGTYAGYYLEGPQKIASDYLKITY